MVDFLYNDQDNTSTLTLLSGHTGVGHSPSAHKTRVPLSHSLHRGQAKRGRGGQAAHWWGCAHRLKLVHTRGRGPDAVGRRPWQVWTTQEGRANMGPPLIPPNRDGGTSGAIIATHISQPQLL
ncbi:hypothetical protein E2C01_005110 [Portunus trituberculatus]|uniref:Uncharacterized protein n=1 Tax=Portunus trituberculatus TaxID=210409 RepID=A0A5B7CRI0_PORTR|nr:hypothetical protein [Portunus trituberculatus]